MNRHWEDGVARHLYSLVVASIAADDWQTLSKSSVTDDDTVSNQLWHCDYHLTHKVIKLLCISTDYSNISFEINTNVHLDNNMTTQYHKNNNYAFPLSVEGPRASQYAIQHIVCRSQAQVNWQGCNRKNIQFKILGWDTGFSRSRLCGCCKRGKSGRVPSINHRRHHFWHATQDCVAPYVDIILHRRRFWAKSAASGSVRWCCFRFCWTVLSHVMRGRPSCLLQSAGGEANRNLLASAFSSVRYTLKTKCSQRL